MQELWDFILEFMLGTNLTSMFSFIHQGRIFENPLYNSQLGATIEDDSLLYRDLNTSEDYAIIQNDLDGQDQKYISLRFVFLRYRPVKVAWQ